MYPSTPPYVPGTEGTGEVFANRYDPPRRLLIVGAVQIAQTDYVAQVSILLGLAMIAGEPLWFFLIELIVLNAVLAFAIVQAAASGRRIIALVARGRQ